MSLCLRSMVRSGLFWVAIFSLIPAISLAAENSAIYGNPDDYREFSNLPDGFSFDYCHLKAATYFGGAGEDDGWPSTQAAFDPEGNIVFAISTRASGLATPGAYDVSWNGTSDVLVVKMNPQLTSVLAATYLGGGAAECAYSLAVDSVGHVYVGGTTSSTGFPITPGAYDGVRVGEEGYVAIFSADLDSLLASTFIGGSSSDWIDDIALGTDGSVYAVIWTASTNLVVTPGAIKSSYGGGDFDFFVARLNNSLTTALAATYLGGNSHEYRARLHVDGNDDIYLTGGTFSTDWIITAGAYDSQNTGNSMDGIIVHMNKDLTTILASTYIGGEHMDWPYCVDVASNGDIYVSGHSDTWPVTLGCFDPTYNGGPGDDGGDAFVGRLSGDLTTLKASTFLGGSRWDWGVDVFVDSNNYIYVAGETTSPDFPSTPNAISEVKSDTTDIVFTVFDSSLTCLHMSTFVGGSGADRWPGILRDANNNLYIIGYTESVNMETTPGCYDPSYNGGGDIYLAAFSFDPFTRSSDIEPVSESECSFGVSWADYDDDQYPDLFVTRWWPSGYHLNALYHNNGDGSFTSRTDLLPGQEGLSIGAAWGDYDNDGDEDLFVACPGTGPSGAPNYLYQNSGDGSFAKITTGLVVTQNTPSVHTLFSDFDLDGDLDLLVANHSTSLGLFYYQNDNGDFTRLDNATIGFNIEDCGAVAAGDANGDGYPEIIHARNMLTSRFYSNDGDGTFTHQTNVVSDDSTRAYAWGDYDNDGDLDLCGGDDWSRGLIIYDNDGDGDFSRRIVDSSDIRTGVMRKPHWMDFDNDGDLDLFVCTEGSGYAPTANELYINDAGVFSKITSSVLVTDLESSSGAAWADYDRDGDLDLFIANTNFSRDALYLNEIGNKNNWISITCVGTSGNRSGIGAKVRVKAIIEGSEIRQMREISSQTGFFGQDEMCAHFGLGDATVIDSIIVEWPSGPIVDCRTDVKVNQYLTIIETRCGNANGDGDVNVGDAVFIINYVFKGGDAPNPIGAGDANDDGDTNVGDAVYLINYIFKGGAPPCA